PQPVLVLHDPPQRHRAPLGLIVGECEHDFVGNATTHVVSVASVEHPEDGAGDDVPCRALDSIVAEWVAAVHKNLTSCYVRVPNVLDSCALLFSLYVFVVLFDALTDAWVGAVDAVA